MSQTTNPNPNPNPANPQSALPPWLQFGGGGGLPGTGDGFWCLWERVYFTPMIYVKHGQTPSGDSNVKLALTIHMRVDPDQDLYSENEKLQITSPHQGSGWLNGDQTLYVEHWDAGNLSNAAPSLDGANKVNLPQDLADLCAVYPNFEPFCGSFVVGQIWNRSNCFHLLNDLNTLDVGAIDPARWNAMATVGVAGLEGLRARMVRTNTPNQPKIQRTKQDGTPDPYQYLAVHEVSKPNAPGVPRAAAQPLAAAPTTPVAAPVTPTPAPAPAAPAAPAAASSNFAPDQVANAINVITTLAAEAGGKVAKSAIPTAALGVEGMQGTMLLLEVITLANAGQAPFTVTGEGYGKGVNPQVDDREFVLS